MYISGLVIIEGLTKYLALWTQKDCLSALMQELFQEQSMYVIDLGTCSVGLYKRLENGVTCFFL